MGMAASQVRFLSLQNRENSIGRQLMTLSNRKMALSRDMDAVALKYTNAMNTKKLQWTSDGGDSYHDLTYDLLMNRNTLNADEPYIVTEKGTNRVVVNDDAVLKANGEEITTKSALLDGKGNTLIDAGENVSYLKLAKLITTFTGTDANGGLLFANSTDFVRTDGKTVGDVQMDNAFQIVNNDNYTYDTNLRYKLYVALGIIDESDEIRHTSLLNELYGSAEAKSRNQYPIGCAMGDYYLALENQSAYKEYVKRNAQSDFDLTISNTYARTCQQTWIDTHFDQDVYSTYTTKTNGGSEGKTTINQEEIWTDYYQYIDYDAVTYKTNISGEDAWVSAYKDSAETSAAYSAHCTSVYNAHGDTYTGNQSGYKQTNIKYTTTVNESGTDKVYEIQDILKNALSNADAGVGTTDFRETLASTDFNDYNGNALNVHKALDNYVNSNGTPSQSTTVKFYLNNTLNIDSGKFESHFDQVVQDIASIIRCNQVVDINEDALESAIDATEAIYLNAIVEDRWSADHTRGALVSSDGSDAGSSDADKLMIDEQCKNVACFAWLYPSGCYGKGSVASVEVGTLFKTLMTFYTGYCSGAPGGQLSTSTTTNTLAPSIELSGDSMTLLDAQQLTGNSYRVSYRTTDASGRNTIVAFITTLTDSTTHYNSDTNSTTSNTELRLYYNPYTSRYSTTPIIGETPITKYVDTQVNDATVITYLADGSNYSGSYCGTVSIGGAIEYAINNTAQLNSLLGGTAFSSSDTTNYTRCGNSYGNGIQASSFDQSYLDSKGYNVTPTFNEKAANVNMFELINARIETNDGYAEHLQSKVDDAWARVERLQQSLNDFYDATTEGEMKYYDAIFLKISNDGWVEDESTSRGTNAHEKKTSTRYLNNMLQNNEYFLTECEELTSVRENNIERFEGFKYTTKQATSITYILEKYDENAVNEAQIEYEEEKALITDKEAAIDTQMEKLETEQSAISKEKSSVQDVIKKRIEKAFKIFA